MVEKIDKALEVVFKIMKVLLILVLVSMVVILMAHIIFRYVLNNSLTWSEAAEDNARLVRHDERCGACSAP